MISRTYTDTKFKKTKLAASLAAATGIMMAQAAHAQGDDVFALEEVVVTATRKETSLQQTAVAVSAFSTEGLEQRGITNLQELDGFVPSLSIGNRAGQGPSAGAITLRGIGVDGLASDGAVGVYIDDVFYGASFGNLLGMMDLERVEVLRGPQGTVFGRNTLAGAVQYISVKPNTDEVEGYVKVVAGNFDRKDFSVGVNLPVSDTFAIRVAGTSQDIEGWVRDESKGEDLGASENQAVRLLAAWTPTDRFSADFKYETVSSENNGPATIVTDFDNNALFNSIARLFGVPAYSAADVSQSFFSNPGTNDPQGFEFDMDIFQATFDFELTDSISLKSITSYQEYDFELVQDFDSTVLPVLTFIRSASGDGTKAFSQEFRIEGSALDDKLSYTAGVFYYDEETESGDLQRVGPAIPTINDFADTGLITDTTESLAVFAQGSYDFTDALTLTVGVRRTEEDVTAEQAATATVFEDDFSETSPYVGLDFRINDDMMVYGKYSEGFRAGGATANPGLPGGGIAFDQDTVETVEFGARLDLMNGRLRVNPTIFQTDWSDIQVNDVLVGAFGPVVSTSNIGDAEIQGLELESLFAATEGLTLNFSLSLLDSEYTRLEPYFQNLYPNGVVFVDIPGVGTVPTGAVPTQNLTTDSDLQRAPEVKYTFGGTYTHGLDNGAEIASSLSYAYTDEQRSATADFGGITLPDYAVVNGRIQFVSADASWTVAVFANNLLDEEYLVGGNDFAAGGTVGVRTEDPARGRAYGLDIEYNF